ncbi:MAG: ATP-binding cassette domain-containing protein [bacterium]
MKVIEVNKLSKVYPGGIEAIRGISFDVEEGEIFGFLGPNGAGKTTTMMMLTTLIKPTSGSAKVCGYDVLKNPNPVRLSIGYVSQDLAVDDSLTGWENLYLQGRFYHIPKDTMEKRIRELLELVHLADRADERVENYSGGMRKRLDIAMGLIHRPKVLFLDEPTLGLDVQTRQDIWSYIARIREENNMTIFLTTHYMEEADNICDRIAIIDHGEIKAIDTPKNLKENLGGDLITLSIKQNNVEVINLFFESIRNIEYVRDIKKSDGRYTIVASKGEKLIPLVFNIAHEKDIEITSIILKQPTLDDVYIAYTGRELRDEEGSREDNRRMDRILRRSR